MMTSKRQRKINRANSAVGLLRQIRAEEEMSSSLDAATWHPHADGESPWNAVVWGDGYARRSPWLRTD